MITRTGIDYSNNSDLSQGTYSGTIERTGQASSITIPYYPDMTDLYVRAYCIDNGTRFNSQIQHYEIDSYNYFWIRNEYAGNNTLTVAQNNSNDSISGTIEYSWDTENWSSINIGRGITNTISLSEGEKIYFRNDSGVWNMGNCVNYFSATQNYSAGGNIMSLVDYTDMEGDISLKRNLFNSMFAGNTRTTNTDNRTLVSIEYLILPSTMSEGCCNSMFENCVSLATLSQNLFRADELAEECYANMFSGCTSLTVPPELPDSKLAASCYNQMFFGCSSLEYAPSLPADTLAAYCYEGMFMDCTSIEAPPELPATTLAEGCYYEMFNGCTSLETAPELPATTLEDFCYTGMFGSCLSLAEAPVLPAETLADSCYNGMFASCTSIKETPLLPATRLAKNCYSGMFQGCSALDTAYDLTATVLEDYCYSHMFQKCESLETAPKLPATTLATDCYDSMFMDCILLNDVPELPATVLEDYCYRQMFYGCTSLDKVITYADDISAIDCTKDWLLGVATPGTLVNLGNARYTLNSASGIPTGWVETNS